MIKPLAVQLYTFRNALAEDRATALARVAEVGFKAVEPFGIGGHGFAANREQAAEKLEDVRLLRDQLDANGLQVVATHGGWTVDESFDAVLDQLEALGTDRLISPAPGTVEGHGEAMKSLEGVQRYAEALNWSADRAASRGVRIGYHNHAFEWEPLPNGEKPYDVLVRELDPRVFLEVDVYWAHTAGLVPADLITSYVDRIELLHVKDGPGGHVLQTPIGTGKVDNIAAIDAGVNVDTAIVELDDCEGDPYDAAKSGAEWLVARDKGTYHVGSRSR